MGSGCEREQLILTHCRGFFFRRLHRQKDSGQALVGGVVDAVKSKQHIPRHATPRHATPRRAVQAEGSRSRSHGHFTLMETPAPREGVSSEGILVPPGVPGGPRHVPARSPRTPRIQ